MLSIIKRSFPEWFMGLYYPLNRLHGSELSCTIAVAWLNNKSCCYFIQVSLEIGSNL